MIEILLFAQLQEESGLQKIEVEKAGINVSELIKWLQEEYKLPSLSQAMVAINESFANQSDVLHDGDVIAFIPPVSGG